MKRTLWAALLSLTLLLAVGCGNSDQYSGDYKTDAKSNTAKEKENMNGQNQPNTLKR